MGTLFDRLAPSPVLASDTPGADHACFADLVEPLGDLLTASEPLRRILSALADGSPFLWQLALREPRRLRQILETDPNDDLARVLRDVAAKCCEASDQGVVRRLLRAARAHVALLVALADLGGLWTLDRVTDALTRAADTFVRCAIDWLLHDAARSGRLTPEAASTGAGLIVLALGKHGASELNYSSDIDLVVLYDADRVSLPGGREPGPFFVRLTQAMVRLLSDRTEDGYVARVDLRLRPDPGSTPVALSMTAALSYYETLGQNWERAAFIKARPIAGDLEAGAAFLRELEPFIWRRYFDYAAIADIHAMKRQIHAVRGFAEIVVAGHDVKLGRGGIREVEFFVQTQQLIFGGRLPAMRGRRTIDMLGILCREGWVTADARDELTAAYTALRTVEHRLQMIADEQTQRLPTDEESLAQFARFCGFAGFDAFSDWITGHFRAVEKHYARLFEHAPGLDAAAGDLVFTGTEDDPATIETLRALGYKRPEIVTETVRGWHFGRRPAVRSARAREVLTDLVPALLQSFAKSGDPDAAVAAFDAALSHMPAATELFSVLRSSAPLRVLFGDILGAAPRLSAVVTATPHVLDAVIDPRSFVSRFDDASFGTEIAALTARDNTEDFLDRCRLAARESQFVIGVRVLSRTIEPRDAGSAFSGLASAIVSAALTHVRRAFARDHGEIADFKLAVLALGKLGSREMTATSDLDLMVVYDTPDRQATSDGRRALTVPLYAARLTQRLIAALTAPTREGRLYDIDMRLRPWGRRDLAVSLDAFRTYHDSEAETWERMALCRARPIAGDDAFRHDLAGVIAGILARDRTVDRLAADIAAMRETIADAKGAADPADLKTLRGGLLDVEFIAQYLLLRHAPGHREIIHPETNAVLTFCEREALLPRDAASTLLSAHRLYSDVVQMQRLALPPDARPRDASENVRRLVATAAGFPDVGALDDALSDTAARVSHLFNEIVKA